MAVKLPDNTPQAGDPPPVRSGKRRMQAAPEPVATIEMEATEDDEEESEDTLLAKLAAIRAKRSAEVQKITLPGLVSIPTMRILLEDNDDIPPTGQYIGHNGNGYLLKTGVWVDVPLPIIEILNNAVMQVPELNAAKQVVGWRDKLRYPYRVAPGQFQQAA